MHETLNHVLHLPPKMHQSFHGKVLEAQKSVMASVANQVTEKIAVADKKQTTLLHSTLFTPYA